MAQYPQRGEPDNSAGNGNDENVHEARLIVPATPEERETRAHDPDLSHTDELISRADVARAHDRPPAPDGELAHRPKSAPLSPQEERVLRESGDSRGRRGRP